MSRRSLEELERRPRLSTEHCQLLAQIALGRYVQQRDELIDVIILLELNNFDIVTQLPKAMNPTMLIELLNSSIGLNEEAYPLLQRVKERIGAKR